jgi:hypothetical protein
MARYKNQWFAGVVNFLGVEVASRISPASTTFSVLIARDEAVKLTVAPEFVSAHAMKSRGNDSITGA